MVALSSAGIRPHDTSRPHGNGGPPVPQGQFLSPQAGRDSLAAVLPLAPFEIVAEGKDDFLDVTDSTLDAGEPLADRSSPDPLPQCSADCSSNQHDKRKQHPSEAGGGD